MVVRINDQTGIKIYIVLCDNNNKLILVHVSFLVFGLENNYLKLKFRSKINRILE